MRIVLKLLSPSRRACFVLAVLMVVVSQTYAAEIDGFTEPYRDIEVAAGEMGRIIHLNVREGDRVKVGQLLARLDDDVLNATLNIAKAAMDSSGRLEAAQAELQMYEESLEKLRELLARTHATPREVDRANSQKEMAEARVKVTREELRVKLLEFERTRTQLEQRRVLSPIEGIVTHLYKDEGEFVSPNDPVVVKVVQLDPLVVVFSVPLGDAKNLATKDSVEIRIESSKKTVQGVVEYVCPTAEPQSGTTRVRVRIPNSDETIPSGVTCHLLLSRDSQELAKAATGK